MDKAIDQYRQALRIDPDHYWSHFQLGRCYLSLSRLAEAVEALGACVALRPEAPWGYSVRGLALAQQKRYRDAEQDLDRAIQLNPDFLPGSPEPGRGLLAQGKNDDALADFEAVLAAPEGETADRGRLLRGQLYLQRGEVQKALDDFDRVIAENPRIRPVYLTGRRSISPRATTTRGLEDLDTYLDRDNRRDPRVWVIHGLRGHLLRDLYQQLPLDKRRQPSGWPLLSLSVTELGKAVAMGGRADDLFDDLGAMLEHAGRIDQAIARLLQGPGARPQGCRSCWSNVAGRTSCSISTTRPRPISPPRSESIPRMRKLTPGWAMSAPSSSTPPRPSGRPTWPCCTGRRITSSFTMWPASTRPCHKPPTTRRRPTKKPPSPCSGARSRYGNARKRMRNQARAKST